MTRCLPQKLRRALANPNAVPGLLWTIHSLGLQLVLLASFLCGYTFLIRTVPTIRLSHFELSMLVAHTMGRLLTPTLSLVDCWKLFAIKVCQIGLSRSEEHTSELQSQSNLVCRLLL